MPSNTFIPPAAVHYPDSDGKRMAENTLQFEWIVTLQGNLDLLFRDNPNVFVAGDHLIYPVEGDNQTAQAPDVYVAFGRPKGHRGSYRVWEEGGVFPQVIFEVWSPGNRPGEMSAKRKFYEKYGAEEYYLLYPEENRLDAWLRGPNGLQEVPNANGFVSPRLCVRFVADGKQLAVFTADYTPFHTFVELGELQLESARRAEEAERGEEEQRQRAERAENAAMSEAQRARAAQESARAAQESAEAAQESARAAQESAKAAQERAERLAERLRALGVDPGAD
jgi:Uma2 family endonuclease